MQAIEKLKQTAKVLRDKKVPHPEQEAESLILYGAGIDRLKLFRDNPLLNQKESEVIEKSLSRRLRGEPLHYIIGYVEFYGLKIRVGRGVLIPRPETELLVDEVLKSEILADGSCVRQPVILDLCTGSGCIALSIADNAPHAEVYATDMSSRALEYARENADLHNIGNVVFLEGNLFEPVEEKKFHIIVSNPPYVKTSDIAMLQEEIRRWEPVEALDAGEDGMDYYRKVFSELDRHLLKNGLCFLEIGCDQRNVVTLLAREYGFKSSCKKDYAGHDRVLQVSF